MWDIEVRDRIKFMLTHNISRSWTEGSSSVRLLADKVTH